MKVIKFESTIHFRQAFTLIELLIVIVIIGILAVALIPRITGTQARARDTQRMADLKTIQTALEFYYAENGYYPSAGVGWKGGSNCDYFNNSTGGDFIPGLVPGYISKLPLDPKPKNTQIDSDGCYIMRSNGTDYMFLVHGTVEGKIPVEFQRPSNPGQKNYAIYSSGARMR